MNSIIALEELIKEEEAQQALQRKQLSAHEAGELKLSRLAHASTERKLEEVQELLVKHKGMLEKLQKVDSEELKEKENTLLAIQRKKYFEEQNMRIKNSSERSDDQKLEVMMILDELQNNIEFEDNELFEIATKSLELNLGDMKELSKELNHIKEKFETMLKNCKDEKIGSLEMLNSRIPILVLQFTVLTNNIKNNFIPKDDTQKTEEKKDALKKEKSTFRGYPKYEDWWIQELWTSHQAYFALFKWKSIITKFCKTGEQKRSWNKIFDNWIFIKKLINDKGVLAYDYHFALDALLYTHAELDEELELKNLQSMEVIIKRITKLEDFSTVGKNHNIETDYLKFKRKRLKTVS